MKKMYALTIFLIAVITVGFLFFHCDTHELNKKLLTKYGISVNRTPISAERFQIPREFDTAYDEYNLFQIECGLDLFPHRGKTAVRYTYKITNLPEGFPENTFANIICVKGKPVAGDIMCPSLDGFICPLNVFAKSKE